MRENNLHRTEASFGQGPEQKDATRARRRRGEAVFQAAAAVGFADQECGEITAAPCLKHTLITFAMLKSTTWRGRGVQDWIFPGATTALQLYVVCCTLHSRETLSLYGSLYFAAYEAVPNYQTPCRRESIKHNRVEVPETDFAFMNGRERSQVDCCPFPQT